MRPRARRARLVTAVFGIALLLGACGIPTSAPKPIPSGQIPFQLTSPNPPVGTTTTIAGGLQVFVYLFDAQGALTAYPRVVAVHGGLAGIIGLLLEGPSPNESQSGVTSALPPGTEIQSVSPINNNVVTVNFNDVFRLAVGSAPVNAVEQVVYTVDKNLTTTSPVGVLFEVDGKPIEVPLPSGIETSSPVTTADYPLTS